MENLFTLTKSNHPNRLYIVHTHTVFEVEHFYWLKINKICEIKLISRKMVQPWKNGFGWNILMGNRIVPINLPFNIVDETDFPVSELTEFFSIYCYAI